VRAVNTVVDHGTPAPRPLGVARSRWDAEIDRRSKGAKGCEGGPVVDLPPLRGPWVERAQKGRSSAQGVRRDGRGGLSGIRGEGDGLTRQTVYRIKGSLEVLRVLWLLGGCEVRQPLAISRKT